MSKNNHSREEVVNFYLDEHGNPRWPKRVLFISRDELTKVDFIKSLKNQNAVGVACLLNDKWEVIGGVVGKIDNLPSGMVVHLIPQIGDFCRFLPIVLIWIPDSDHEKAGMLY